MLKEPTEASKQCLALANLYINREDFEKAYDRLQEAKLLDPRVSVAPGLEAIRRAPGLGRGHGPLDHAWPLRGRKGSSHA